MFSTKEILYHSHPYGQYTRILFSPYPYQHLLFIIIFFNFFLFIIF